MVAFKNKELAFLLASQLADVYPDDQFLPDELNESLLAIIDSVGLAALNLAVARTWEQMGESKAPEDFESTVQIETSNGFETEYVPKGRIVSSISDASGFDEEVSATLLSALENIVNAYLFGGEHENRQEVELEGIGVISPGDLEGSYRIALDKSLHVSPLLHIRLLSEFERVADQADVSNAASGI